MTPFEIIQYIGARDVLRIEQWRNDEKGNRVYDGSWRVGINWFSDTEYDFIVEKPTLDEALTVAYENHYLKISEDPKQIINPLKRWKP